MYHPRVSNESGHPPKQLVLAPQLQLAIELLATPSSHIPALIATLSGHQIARDGDPDPLDEPTDEEQQLQAETGVRPWGFTRDVPADFAVQNADVWIYRDPPIARANREALPRIVATDRDGAWLARALRQRARHYERFCEAILEQRPALATSAQIEPLAVRELAEATGLHESTLGRIARGCRVQNRAGVFGFTIDGASGSVQLRG